jgi:hypothetical protein
LDPAFRCCKSDSAALSITVIEWDPAMVEVSDRVQYFSTELRPRILVGDVRTVLPELHETFDVVVGDIFDGVHVSEAMRDEHVRDQLRRVLSRHGTFIFNALSRAGAFFSVSGETLAPKKVEVHMELVGDLSARSDAARSEIRCRQGIALPARGTRMLTRESSAGSLYLHVGRPECPGMRWHHGPLWFEGYTGDTEPLVDERGSWATRHVATGDAAEASPRVVAFVACRRVRS